MSYPMPNMAINENAGSEKVLPSITNRISKIYQEQGKLISEIENKVHSILNLRTPDKLSDKRQDPESMIDFSQTMNKDLTLLNENNDRLNKIIIHLNQII